MRARDRLAIPMLVLALCAAAGPAGAVTALAAAPADDLFAMPTADELPTAAAATVQDTPPTPPDVVDLTPVIATAAEDVAALPAELWEVDALAKTLGDPTGAFELVRDSIRFDAYPGVLRDAAGTLAARAGNAFDRALLLKALLDAQGSTTRLAFGQLGADTATSLVTGTLDEPVAPLPVPDFSPFDAAFEQAVDARARRDYALLSEALGDRLSGLDADGTAAAIADVTSHAWVQVAQPDGTWLDLDPSLPGALPGQALTTVDTTAEVMPDETRQMVTLRVIAETLEDGWLYESTLLEAPLDAATVAPRRVLLAFQSASEGGSLLGGGVGGLLGGSAGQGEAFSPILMIDENAWLGNAVLIVSEGGGGGLLGGGGGQVDLASLSPEVQVDVPGADPEVLRHVIADRVPAAARASGSVTPDDLIAVQDAEGMPAVFANILHVMVSTGGSSPRAYAADQGYAAEMAAWGANAADADVGQATMDEALLPVAVADAVMVVVSERRILPALNDAEVRAFVARPRVYVASQGVDAVDPSLDIVGTDLLTDGIRILPRAGTPADAVARHQLWYGVLQGAVETEYTLVNAATIERAGLTMSGVSFDMAKPLSVLTAADSTLPEAADSTLGHTLAAGGLAVVPGDPSSATTWWQLAADSTTRSIVAPRRGAAIRGGLPRSIPSRVEPVLPSKPGDNKKGKDGGNEYLNVLKVQKEVAPNVQKGGQIVQDSFDSGANAALQLARRKALGGG